MNDDIEIYVDKMNIDIPHDLYFNQQMYDYVIGFFFFLNFAREF